MTALGGSESLTYGYTGALNTSVVAASADPARTGGEISWRFDEFMRTDRLILMSDDVPSSKTLGFERDGDSLLTDVVDHSTSVPVTLVHMEREEDTGLVTNVETGDLVDTRSYNEFGEVEFYTVAWDDGVSTPYQVEFRYDKLGRITDKIETVVDGDHVSSGTVETVWEYAYDEADRLWQVLKDEVEVEEYEYDANGNRTRKEENDSPTQTDFVINNQDQLVQYMDSGTTVTLEYDANGEMTAKDVEGGERTEYEYDAFGQLVKVTLDAGGGGEQVIDYILDPLGRRVAKKVDGDIVRQWVYDGLLYPAIELDENGDAVAYFVGGTTMIRPSGPEAGTYTLVRDHLGSVRFVVNQDSGVIAQRMDYDAYGNVLIDTNPEFQPFGFAGGLYDPATSLVKLGVRDYFGLIGRWMQKEPLQFDGGMNFYIYSASEPVNLVDRTGFDFGEVSGWNDFSSGSDPLWEQRLHEFRDIHALSQELGEGYDPRCGGRMLDAFDALNGLDLQTWDYDMFAAYNDKGLLHKFVVIRPTTPVGTPTIPWKHPDNLVLDSWSNWSWMGLNNGESSLFGEPSSPVLRRAGDYIEKYNDGWSRYSGTNPSTNKPLGWLLNKCFGR